MNPSKAHAVGMTQQQRYHEVEWKGNRDSPSVSPWRVTGLSQYGSVRNVS